MSDNSYEEYKRELSRSQKKADRCYRGKGLLISGAFMLIYFLVIFPYKAGNVGEIRGDEVKAGDAYSRVHVYYIDKLQILNIKNDTDDERIYCIAKFADCDQKEWIICFTPGNDKKLEESIQLAGMFDKEPDLTINGYFRMEFLEGVSSGADAYYSVFADGYADAEASNLLKLNAEYLCGRTENYILAVVCRPGIPLGSLVIGLIGVLYGGFLLIRNQKRKTA